MSGTRRNACKKVVLVELILETLVDLGGSLGGGASPLEGLRALGLSDLLRGLLSLLLVKLNVVSLEVPLTERSGVDPHDAVLH